MDIQPTDSDNREIVSALLMREILDIFGDEPEVAVLAAQLIHANKKILSTEMIRLIIESLETLGIDDAWDVLAVFGSFHHTCQSYLTFDST